MLALHEKDIFHQAISKRSIFIIPSENGSPQVSVLSVGVGIAHEQDIENLKCAAPEAITKPNRARIRSDLYSVSMLLAQILTDKDLIAGKTSEEVRKAVEDTTVFDDLQLPREIPTKISEEIRDILLNRHLDDICDRTEALLMTGSRSQLTYEIILPKFMKLFVGSAGNP